MAYLVQDIVVEHLFGHQGGYLADVKVHGASATSALIFTMSLTDSGNTAGAATEEQRLGDPPKNYPGRLFFKGQQLPAYACALRRRELEGKEEASGGCSVGHCTVSAGLSPACAAKRVVWLWTLAHPTYTPRLFWPGIAKTFIVIQLLQIREDRQLARIFGIQSALHVGDDLFPPSVS